jgi:hypothetical protein
MDVRDLDRIAFVTRHFRELQGLRKQVPAGMLVLGIGLMPTLYLGPLDWRILYLKLFSLLMVGLLGGNAALTFWSPRYYRNLFGEVEVRPRTPPSSYWTIVFLVSLVLLALFAEGSFSLWRALGVLLGSFHLAAWCRREHRWSQSYTLFLGGLLLASAVLFPGNSFTAEQRILNGMAEISPTLAHLLDPADQLVFGSLAGFSLILAGLLDHRQLVRTLGQLPPPDADEATAQLAPKPA